MHLVQRHIFRSSDLPDLNEMTIQPAYSNGAQQQLEIPAILSVVILLGTISFGGKQSFQIWQLDQIWLKPAIALGCFQFS